MKDHSNCPTLWRKWSWLWIDLLLKLGLILGSYWIGQWQGKWIWHHAMIIIMRAAGCLKLFERNFQSDIVLNRRQFSMYCGVILTCPTVSLDEYHQVCNSMYSGSCQFSRLVQYLDRTYQIRSHRIDDAQRNAELRHVCRTLLDFRSALEWSINDLISWTR